MGESKPQFRRIRVDNQTYSMIEELAKLAKCSVDEMAMRLCKRLMDKTKTAELNENK